MTHAVAGLRLAALVLGALLSAPVLAAVGRVGLRRLVMVHDCIPLDHPAYSRADAPAAFAAKLAAVMRERIDGIERITGQVRDWLPEIRAALRAKLDGKLADLKLPLEPGRLEQEVVLNLQKIDVDEELDRLASHVAEARRVLGLPEAVGRRLDFLMQEFNREANTLGSKSVDSRTTQAAVELKVLIEQLREQVQNLE